MIIKGVTHAHLGPSPNVSTTPLRQWGFRQCLPFSWTTLRGKHCQHPIAIMGVIDTFRPIWYHSGPTDVPYSPNQFLGWDFFCRFLQQTSSKYSRTLLEGLCDIIAAHTFFRRATYSKQLESLLMIRQKWNKKPQSQIHRSFVILIIINARFRMLLARTRTHAIARVRARTHLRNPPFFDFLENI